MVKNLINSCSLATIICTQKTSQKLLIITIIYEAYFLGFCNFMACLKGKSDFIEKRVLDLFYAKILIYKCALRKLLPWNGSQIKQKIFQPSKILVPETKNI